MAGKERAKNEKEERKERQRVKGKKRRGETDVVDLEAGVRTTLLTGAEKDLIRDQEPTAQTERASVTCQVTWVLVVLGGEASIYYKHGTL